MPIAAITPAVATLLAGGAAAGAGVYAAHAAGSSANKAAQYQATTANQAAQIESQSAADALAFQREQEAQRQKEWQSTQDRNYGIYQEERDYRRGNLRPYQQLGTRAIGQLLQPIVQRPQPGSVAALMGRG